MPIPSYFWAEVNFRAISNFWTSYVPSHHHSNDITWFDHHHTGGSQRCLVATPLVADYNVLGFDVVLFADFQWQDNFLHYDICWCFIINWLFLIFIVHRGRNLDPPHRRFHGLRPTPRRWILDYRTRKYYGRKRRAIGLLMHEACCESFSQHWWWRWICHVRQPEKIFVIFESISGIIHQYVRVN